LYLSYGGVLVVRAISIRRGGATDIYWIYIAVVVGVHVAIWEEAIWKEGEKDELGQSKQFVS
jgi:hypothetical protein